jgi:predicted dithiol-disulfide oxidoreductase (DUF899 family)
LPILAVTAAGGGLLVGLRVRLASVLTAIRRPPKLSLSLKEEKRMTSSSATHAKVVSRSEWLEARLRLLAREKELTRQYDGVAAARRALPWVKVEKEYVFDGPEGKVTLADLFQNRRQLIVRHFMFAPGWGEGCVGCSFLADHIDGARIHLEQHDVSFVAISRAPYSEIAAFQKRMGWRFRWVSSYASDFNYDYHVSFRPEEINSGKVYHNFELREPASEERAGNSVFYKDESGIVFHTYSTYGRGDELLVGAYVYLDLTPRGRNETLRGNLTDWVRHRDRYGAGGSVDLAGRYVASQDSGPSLSADSSQIPQEARIASHSKVPCCQQPE